MDIDLLRRIAWVLPERPLGPRGVTAPPAKESTLISFRWTNAKRCPTGDTRPAIEPKTAKSISTSGSLGLSSSAWR